jgi:hypothetical protein
MPPRDRQAQADWLATLGVPGSFRDAILDTPPSKGGTALALAMVALAIAGMIAAFMWLTRDVEARAAAVAAQNGAALIHVDVGLGPLTLLFGLLALMGWAAIVRIARQKEPQFVSAAAGLLTLPPRSGLTRWVTQWILQGSVRCAGDASATVEDFLCRMVNHQARRWGMAAIVLLLPALLITLLETNNFWVAGSSGIVEHRLLPPFSSRRLELNAASSLITGCNHTDKGDHLIYQIGFPSAGAFDLGGSKAVSGETVAAIEGVAGKLGGKVEHVRWSHLGRNPVHPTCLNAWAARFDRDGRNRLAKLLRLTPEETRTWSLR